MGKQSQLKKEKAKGKVLVLPPKSKYDPPIGRRIAAKGDLMCYGEETGGILAFYPTSYGMFKGHKQQVSDMAFHTDVHRLASASVDGRFFIRDISEDQKKEKSQIIGKTVLAIQIEVKEEVTQPRICWHSDKQEILIIAIGNHILKVDTTKAQKCREEPIKFPIHAVIQGVQIIGKHDLEVTNISTCKPLPRLVSSSMDGTVKIWDEIKGYKQLFVFKPFMGEPVNSAAFFSAPQRPKCNILITTGPLNRQVKFWASDCEDWLLRDVKSWHCTKTYDVGTCIPDVGTALHVVVLSQESALLFGNANNDHVVVMGIEFGSYPTATHMQYSVTSSFSTPIMSFIGEFLPTGEHILEFHCATQARDPIEVHHLDLSRWRSTTLDSIESLGTEVPSATSALKSTIQDSASSSTEASTVDIGTDIRCDASPPIPLNPRLSANLSSFRGSSSSYDPSPPRTDLNEDLSGHEYTVDRQVDNIHPSFSYKTDDDSCNDETKVSQDDVRNSPVSGKSEGDGNIQDVTVNGETVSLEVEVKVVGEAGSAQNSQSNFRASPITLVTGNNDKIYSSQNLDLGIEMSTECCAISAETYIAEEAREVYVANMTESLDNNGNGSESEVYGSTKDVSGKVVDSAIPSTVTQLPSPSSPSPGVFNSVDSSGEPGAASSSIPFVEVDLPQILAMQESINQLIINQKEMQKQLPLTVAALVTKEGRRLEAALGLTMEKGVEANTDALWARFQEENAKLEKLAWDSTQQITSLIINFMNKDLPVMLEKTIKKEVAAVGPAIAHLITPGVEKSISSSIAESFQRGVGDKAANQLERSVTTKLEARVGRQIQAQFQSSGKQALQDALKSCLEGSVIPAFEKSCQTMFEQVDVTFQKGMAEHTNAAQQHFESTHSGLALALRDAINSASSVTQNLRGELADGQQMLLALAAAGANANAGSSLVSQLSNGPLSGLYDKVEVPVDPTKELSRLIAERKYEDAFTAALERSDCHIVSWLCSQVDLHRFLSEGYIPLSQGVLLSLLQQLACDIHRDTPTKLGWMTAVSVAVNPSDPMIAVHVRPIFEQVYQLLSHHRSLSMVTPSELSSIRVVMHVINSVLGVL